MLFGKQTEVQQMTIKGFNEVWHENTPIKRNDHC